ncbi:MaoC family dehydratase [Paenarthrobacter aurescens]|uniref:MaoC family dehydratase n=1 Tax=Paenarthrobacter aurescens TaxID=43663 RepID=UPI0035F0D2E7
MSIYANIAAAESAGGVEVVSDWLEITQERVSTFADATEDHQWIHLDYDRAKESPFGGTIAHGFLTLSLLTRLTEGAVQIEGTVMSINYGLNKVRFVHPVPVGSRIRARSSIASVERVPQGARIATNIVVEIDGVHKPAAVAEMIALHVLDESSGR